MRGCLLLLCACAGVWADDAKLPTGITFIDHGVHDKRYEGYRTPHGFRLELVAETPTLKHAEGLAFTPDGTLIVVTRHNVQALPFDTKTQQFQKGVVLLEGIFGTSVEVRGDWLYIAGRGVVQRWRFAELRDGKNTNAKPERLVHGLKDLPHNPRLAFALDGGLLLGTDGEATVTGADGQQIRTTREGCVLQCRTDGTKLTTFALGIVVPRDLYRDDLGQLLRLDSAPERQLLPIPDGHHGRDPSGPSYTEPAQGIFYDDAQLPPFYRRWFYVADPERATVQAIKQAPAGSTSETRARFPLLTGPAKQFHPTHVLAGPDGAIYVGELNRLWRLSWAGGNVPGEPEPHDAIALRERSTWTTLRTANVETLLMALQGPDGSTRERAAEELLQRKDTAKHFQRLAADAEPPLAMRVLCFHMAAQTWDAQVQELCVTHLRDADPGLRTVAAELLGRHSNAKEMAVVEALEVLLADPNKAVRRTTALALGRINAEASLDALVSTFRTDDGSDPHLSEGLLRAIERTGKPGLAKLLELGRSGNDNERDRVVQAFDRGCTRAAAELALELLVDPHLSETQQSDLLRAYGKHRFDPPLSFAALEKALHTDKLPLKTVAAGLEQMHVAKQLSPTSLDLMKRVLQGDDSAAAVQVATIINQAGYRPALPLVYKLACTAQCPLELRVMCITALRHAGKDYADPLVQLIDQVKEPALHVAIIRTVAILDPDTAPRVAAPFLAAKESDLAREAIRIVGTSPKEALAIGERYLQGSGTRELLPTITHVLQRHAAKDPTTATMLTKVLQHGLLPKDEGQVEQVRQLVLTRGDALEGRRLFLDNCARCHTLGNAGTRFGPDLSTLWESATIPSVLTALLEPHKDVKDAYRTFTVTTKDKLTAHGLKLADTPDEVRLQTPTDVRTFAKANIAELKPLPTSLMPDQLAAQMPLSSLLHLVAFLQNRGAQESMRGLVRSYRVATTFDAKHPPEADGPVTWQTRATTTGLITVKEPTYATFTIQVPTPRTVTFFLEFSQSKHDVSLWVNGRVVSGGERRDVHLQAGRNDILLRVTGDGRVFVPPSTGLEVRPAP